VSRKDGSSAVETVAESDLLAVCERLSRQGAFALNITRIDAAAAIVAAPVAPTVTPVAPATIPAPPPVASDTGATSAVSTWTAQVADHNAKARIEGQHAALAAAGVHVDASQQLYATGTRLAQVGYDTQAARAAEHAAAAPVRDVADRLMAIVRAEGREDRIVTAREVGASIHVNGKITCLDGFALSEHAIRGLASRIDSPMISYVLGIRDRMAERSRTMGGDAARDANDADRREIARVLQHECALAGDARVMLRTRARGMGGAPDIYATVSEGYSVADATRALPEVVAGLPRNAKGTYSYDPASTAWELRADVWTPTPVAEQAVGEAFRGYVSYHSRDNGTGSFDAGGGVELLRCLNASTYTSNGSHVRRVHRGRILFDVQRMTRGALKAIDALCAAWGKNRADVVDLPRTTDGTDRPIPIEQAIPGFWSYLLRDRSSELAGVLPGRSAEHVKGLTRAFFGERRDFSRLVRSDFAQGWTKYIQAQPTDVRREAEGAIGEWLVKPRPIRFDAPQA